MDRDHLRFDVQRQERELIRRVKRARIARQKVVVLKPAIDTRFSSSDVVSHGGDKIECIAVRTWRRPLPASPTTCRWWP